MPKNKSSILIFGICETPSILWDAYLASKDTPHVNRQYIVLEDKPTTVRIGSVGWAEMNPEELLRFENNAELVVFTKELIFSKVNSFSKPIKNALTHYFQWVGQKCMAFQESSEKVDPLFSNVEQLFFKAPLLLPHPKVTLCDEQGNFSGVVNFDLSFIIEDITYLISLSEGQFIRKSERDLREQLMNSNDKIRYINLNKPNEINKLDTIFINKLLSYIPSLNHFLEDNTLPNSIYHLTGLDALGD
jgi:hypothetical protein